MFHPILKSRLKDNRGTEAPNLIVRKGKDGDVDSREDNENNNAGIRLTQVSGYRSNTSGEKGMKIFGII